MEDIDKDRIDVGDISVDERNNENDGGNNENMGNEKNDTQNEDADPHKHAFQMNPRKRTSTIWNDFEEVVDTNGSKKAKCNYCLAKFNMPSTGATTQFHWHLKHCTQRQLASKKQMVLSVETVASDCARSIANFKYDHAKLWRIKVILNEKFVDDNEFIRAMASMMKAKFDKYWSECNLLMAIAVVLDPRYKMIIVNYCFSEIYLKAKANKNIAIVKQVLYEIYNEYVVTHAATHTAQGESGQGKAQEIGSSSASGGDHDIRKKIVTGSSGLWKASALGGFDTAHAAARAYDRAAIKFCGFDADINFNISDYEEDLKQELDKGRICAHPSSLEHRLLKRKLKIQRSNPTQIHAMGSSNRGNFSARSEKHLN
ncbi:hypothetical protein F0562_025410 [Nyssa sinensis]|uniref:BED-type domain-containing protein n=1 Tax=Nyssa sinensis TaxID=561372 RepID=A0A5J5BI25_9ASTE|nr:hypothetical protein F0562_025410 [Nyssa sinensis]